MKVFSEILIIFYINSCEILNFIKTLIQYNGEIINQFKNAKKYPLSDNFRYTYFE